MVLATTFWYVFFESHLYSQWYRFQLPFCHGIVILALWWRKICYQQLHYCLFYLFHLNSSVEYCGHKETIVFLLFLTCKSAFVRATLSHFDLLWYPSVIGSGWAILFIRLQSQSHFDGIQICQAQFIQIPGPIHPKVLFHLWQQRDWQSNLNRLWVDWRPSSWKSCPSNPCQEWWYLLQKCLEVTRRPYYKFLLWQISSPSL